MFRSLPCVVDVCNLRANKVASGVQTEPGIERGSRAGRKRVGGGLKSGIGGNIGLQAPIGFDEDSAMARSQRCREHITRRA